MRWIWFWLLQDQSWGLTRAELGPGSSPLVSGVSESLRFRSSENSCVTGVCGCCSVKTEDVLGRDWATASLGSSSVMSSQDYRNINKKQLWDDNDASVQSCVNSASLWLIRLWCKHFLSRCPGPWAPCARSPSLHWCGAWNGKHGVLLDGSAVADCHSPSQKSHPWGRKHNLNSC